MNHGQRPSFKNLLIAVSDLQFSEWVGKLFFVQLIKFFGSLFFDIHTTSKFLLSCLNVPSTRILYMCVDTYIRNTKQIFDMWKT